MQPPADLTLNALLDSVACGVAITNADLNIIRINNSAEAITGISKDQAKGMVCEQLLRPLRTDRSSCPLQSCVDAGKNHDERTISILGRDDIEIRVRIVSRLIHNSSGELLGGIVTFGDLATVQDLRLRLDHRHVFHSMVSRNHRMRTIFELLPRMANSNSTVLIRGETGTGKELIARAIHDLSDRENKPFVSVNTAALPDTLLEAELFGHTKGAFTDAKTDRAGRIAIAEGGTLFLDEIGDISPMIQVKLLRFLQERQYEPLGSSTVKTANVRVIAATNRDLESMLAEGIFREDFYYRLNVLTVELPPLRERVDDLPLLVEHFLQRVDLIENNAPRLIAPAAMQALLNYDWPGNVRELENVIERAAVLARGDAVQPGDLPPALRKMADSNGEQQSNFIPSSHFTPVELAERETIRETLNQFDGSRLETANTLSMSRSTLWRKMKKYLLD